MTWILALLLVIVPAFQFEPGFVTYTITIERDAANMGYAQGWALCSPEPELDCDIHEQNMALRRSYTELAGIYAPRTFTHRWTNLPGGRYLGFVEVYRRVEDTPTVVEVIMHPFEIIGH